VHWFYLSLAIVAEVIATSSLKATENFSRLWPSVLVIVGYALAFYLLTLTLKTIPVGVAYAIWSGVGIVLVAIFSWLYYQQTLDLPAIIGMALIIAGVIVMNLFSKSIVH
jgi:small multidrug resistance pump